MYNFFLHCPGFDVARSPVQFERGQSARVNLILLANQKVFLIVPLTRNYTVSIFETTQFRGTQYKVTRSSVS